ncbi:hypothetical protein A2480_03155 [Candidatus Uhrbacteria bacterium RIFOXYC2_FULL_47_19]|uniref:Uncharacterized protein n=1 Tax=Candidatus Uhrbacteria bacterium RIFOXYC2_FULL_47_19 TaxID=1802424 RepID=A0A1F7WDV5_9BACT|nr:MAG: hypothetical protein A2480_03155 [Candidatus Uhrbacteria bacterium RIFOXYC2_FULL_47_19]HCC21825.1 hypothetical protein [Candidatus Uhrbacteria bacterium]
MQFAVFHGGRVLFLLDWGQILIFSVYVSASGSRVSARDDSVFCHLNSSYESVIPTFYFVILKPQAFLFCHLETSSLF